jgi:hypothetical protein
MKAFALFLFRLATAAYLVAWAVVKLVSTERAIEISKTFYFGYFDDPIVQHGLGALAAVLGIFVALGFLRAFAYPVQALVLAVAAAAVGKAVVAPPVDLANGIEAATLLLPTLGVFFVSLAPLVWWKDDFLSLDRFIAWRLDGLATEAAATATATATGPAIAAAAHDNHGDHGEAGHTQHDHAHHGADHAPAANSHAEESHAEAHAEAHGGAHVDEGHGSEGHGEAAHAPAHAEEAVAAAHHDDADHGGHGHAEKHDAHPAPATLH